jgi:carbon monoxide dehydrogenase subunit G
MKITGEHTFRSPRQRVWEALQDPQMLANSLPGVKRLEVTGPDEYAMTVSVGVGSVKGTYDGTFKLTDKQDAEACSVRANASGGPGSVDAVARMQMRDGDGGGAVLTYEADANVTGPLAGVGQRLIGGAARKTTKEFLGALDRQLLSPAPAAAGDGAAPTAEQPAAEAQEAPARGAVFAPSAPAGAERTGVDPVVIAASALAGFLMALVGIAVGRWTARH